MNRWIWACALSVFVWSCGRMQQAGERSRRHTREHRKALERTLGLEYVGDGP